MSMKFPNKELALAEGCRLAGVGPEIMEGPFWIRVANPSNTAQEPGIYDVEVYRLTLPDGNRVAIGVAPIRGGHRDMGRIWRHYLGDWELWAITDGAMKRL